MGPVLLVFVQINSRHASSEIMLPDLFSFVI